MASMSNERILLEFRRQVYLCSGLGRETLLAVVNEFFDDPTVADGFRHGFYSDKGSKAKWQI